MLDGDGHPADEDQNARRRGVFRPSAREPTGEVEPEPRSGVPAVAVDGETHVHPGHREGAHGLGGCITHKPRAGTVSPKRE